jgi:murein DD-endopeptidase MepM/ murein hydrolase activator NlpD
MVQTLPKGGKKPRIGSNSRSHRAISDAQESLDSLLNAPAITDEPEILSPSGVVRNSKGRIAGPSSRLNQQSPRGAIRLSSDPLQVHRLADGLVDKTSSVDSFLALAPSAKPIYEDEDSAASFPPSRLQTGLARAQDTVQSARDRVGLLVNVDDLNGPGALGFGVSPEDIAAAHTSRRHAARWVTRYATHIIILLIVGGLVVLGGLKTLTVQNPYPNGLSAVDSAQGTDSFGDEDAADSPDYALTLPRTELGGTEAAADSRIYQAPATGGTTAADPATQARTTVTAYTVEAGDTIASIAAKFNVMPETVMGSNAIWDAEQELDPGEILQVPPIDGMYYVPHAGDTLDTVARYFQADPSLIIGYGPNNLSDGTVKVGQPLVVPSGMMPQRTADLTYSTREGDTLKKIAARFQLDVPTIVHANDIPDPAAIAPGTQLRILPVIGMEYKVASGDTVLSVADKFGVTSQNILDFTPNNLTAGSTLTADAVIMVPGGSPPSEVAAARLASAKQEEEAAAKKTTSSQAAKTTSSSSGSDASKTITKSAPPKAAPAPQSSYTGGSGSLGWPLSNFVITQYFSSHHNGLDLAAPAGTPIHAAGSGEVIWAGWRTDGLGYCVFIDHQNGLLTVYGHMIRQPSVRVGQYVSRGQVIGNVGSTGNSTGPHTHFMVKVGSGRDYRNPLAWLSSR